MKDRNAFGAANLTSKSTMKHRLIPISQAFKFAWPIFRKHFGLFSAILLTIAGAWAVLEIVVIAGQRFGILLWVAMHLIFLSFLAGVELGFLQISLALCDGKEPTFADAFKQLALGPKFLVGQIIYLLISALGFLLLVVPGAYLSARYALFGFCMATGQVSLMRSFQQSADLSAGVKIYLFSILLFLLALNALGASLLGLGLLITVPLSVLIMTTIYRQLSMADTPRA
jgi:hypothetical protein